LESNIDLPVFLAHILPSSCEFVYEDVATWPRHGNSYLVSEDRFLVDTDCSGVSVVEWGKVAFGLKLLSKVRASPTLL
jgi:hypothetical protein